MKLMIDIDLDNNAFVNHNGHEASRILYNLSQDRIKGQILEVGDTMTLMDLNGNRVGQAKVVKA